MFCRECGAEIKNNGKFCPVCGTKVKNMQQCFEEEKNYVDIEEIRIPVKENAAQTVATNIESSINNSNLAEVMSVWSYVGLFIIGAIPIVGIIVIIIFAINSSNKNKTNYCRAIIVLWLIGVILTLLFGASIFGLSTSIY